MQREHPSEVHKTDLSLLYELSCLHQLQLQFTEVGKEGPSHALTFHIQLAVGDLVAFGAGPTKQKAKLGAAKLVLHQLRKRPLPEDVTPYWSKPRMELVDPSQRVYFFYKKDPISALAEILIVRKQRPAEYKVVRFRRSGYHASEFSMEVRVDQRTCQGVGPNKKAAKLQAAEAMLHMMGFKEQMERENPQLSPSEELLFQQQVFKLRETEKFQARQAFKATVAPAQKDTQASQSESSPPALQGPIPEEPILEEPASDEPIRKEPIREEPTIEEPIRAEPVYEEPIIEEPIIKEQIRDEPVSEEPIREQPEEPITEEPIIEEPIIEEPIREEPVYEEPIIEEPIRDEPVYEEPIIEEPIREEPIREEPTIEEPIREEPVYEEPIIEEPIIKEQIREEPVSKEPIREHPEETITEEPIIEEPIEEEPIIEEPIIEEPIREEPVYEEPIIEEPIREEPVNEEPIREEQIIKEKILELPVPEDLVSEDLVPEDLVPEDLVSEDLLQTLCALAPTSPEQDSPVDLDSISSLDLVSPLQDHNPPKVIQVPLAPEAPNLQDCSSPSETVSSIERAVAPETQDISSDAAHFMVSTMIRKLLEKSPVSLDIREQLKVILQLREVERRLSMPQGTDLKTKDLKAVAKETARSLQEELGPISSALLQSESFLNAAVRHVNLQLENFSHEDRGRRQGCFFSRVFKMFRTRKSRVSPGPLRAYLRSAI